MNDLKSVFAYLDVWFMKNAHINEYTIYTVNNNEKGPFELIAGNMEIYVTVSIYFEESLKFTLISKDIDKLAIYFKIKEK